jgi:hypothetical protein
MLFPDLQILKNTYKNLVGKPEGKRLFPRPWPTWGIILKGILKSAVWVYGLDSSTSGCG